VKRFKFLDKKKLSQLPEDSGVYAFIEKDIILYVGKAVNIKKRVKSHFQQPNFKDSLFIERTDKIGFIKTGSEIEALVLEAKLIKKLFPKFNVLWRDDKNYFYLKITKEKFPRVYITHQKDGRARYIGPFVDGKSLKQALKISRKIFPFRSCRIIPKKTCLWYNLKRCPAPCLLKTGLGKQIPKAKETIQKECQKNTKNTVKIFKGERKQVLKDLEKEMKKAVSTQFFEKAAETRDQIRALENILAHGIILENIEFTTEWPAIQKNLQRVIRTKKDLSQIEAYDVSNFQGKEAVGSMVVFIKGKPDKSLYRRFKIKSLEEKPNDTAMIKEVLKRRMKHPEWLCPNFILVDGGKGQLSAVKSSLLEKEIKVAALAKRKNELFIEGQKKPILLKKINREVFNLILQLRDEAHRFAIAYHRKLRKKKLLD